MKLERCKSWNPDAYVCDLTRKLDELAGLDMHKDYDMFYHYILYDEWDKRNCLMAIRVPGGTVGEIILDENDNIYKIGIDTKYVIDTYPDDVNEKIKEFVGVRIEHEKQRS